MFSSRRLRPAAFGLAALIALFALDRVAAAGLRWVLLRSDHRVAQAYSGAAAAEVLVLGSSVANAMLSPPNLQAATGRRSFSIALHGLDAVTQEALAVDYLAANPAPRLALMEIRAARAVRVRAAELRLFARGGDRIAALAAGQQASLVPWTEVFHVHRLNSPLLPRAIQSLVDRDDQATGASDGRITPAIIQAWRRDTPSRPVQPAQVRAFGATATALAAAGAVPVVVIAPLHPSARHQAVEGVAEVSPLLPPEAVICDFSGLLDEDRSFEDPAHMNAQGRAAFTPVLAELVRRALVPDGAPAWTPDPATATPDGPVSRLCRAAGARSAA